MKQPVPVLRYNLSQISRDMLIALIRRKVPLDVTTRDKLIVSPKEKPSGWDIPDVLRGVAGDVLLHCHEELGRDEDGRFAVICAAPSGNPFMTYDTDGSTGYFSVTGDVVLVTTYEDDHIVIERHRVGHAQVNQDWPNKLVLSYESIFDDHASRLASVHARFGEAIAAGRAKLNCASCDHVHFQKSREAESPRLATPSWPVAPNLHHSAPHRSLVLAR